jgi:uroporphyrinogen-III synthase
VAAPPAVLITRPEPGAAETAAAVAALGWRPVLAPALVLAPLPPPAGLLSPAQALLLPSRASARALALSDMARDMPVLAVGQGTATEARAAGFIHVTAAEGDAASLARQAAALLDPRGGALLLAVGQGYGLPLAAALRAHDFKVRRQIVYAARPAGSLPPEAIAALCADEVSAALFFSPRSAVVTMALLRRSGLAATVRGVLALALSERIAAALAGISWKDIHATPSPEASALLALLGPAPHMAAMTAERGA